MVRLVACSMKALATLSESPVHRPSVRGGHYRLPLQGCLHHHPLTLYTKLVELLRSDFRAGLLSRATFRSLDTLDSIGDESSGWGEWEEGRTKAQPTPACEWEKNLTDLFGA